MSYRLVVLVISVLGSLFVTAQTCCSGGVPLAGNLGLPAGESGQVQLGLTYDLNRLRRLYTGSEAFDETSRIRNTQTVLFEASYAFSKRWSLDVLLPWIHQQRIIERTTTVRDATTGLGDAVLLARRQWLPPSPGKAWQWSSGLGVKLANGAADRASEFGFTYNADLQPGSGALDLILWNRLGHQPAFRPSLSVYLTTVHRRRGVNDDYLPTTNPANGVRTTQTYRFGTETQLTLGITDQLLAFNRLLAPGLSLLYRHAAGDRTNDVITPSTGGDFLFVQPSLGVEFGPSVSWQFAADLPVYTRVVGTQVAPTLRLNTGFLISIKTKE